jgi:tripartite-type tricarboxylate transporter receptor subunit TctC
MEEAGVPNFKVTIWQGFSARAGTPKPIVDKLNASMREALQVPEVVERFDQLGVERIGSTPEEFSALVAREIQTWGDVVRRSGIEVH